MGIPLKGLFSCAGNRRLLCGPSGHIFAPGRVVFSHGGQAGRVFSGEVIFFPLVAGEVVERRGFLPLELADVFPWAIAHGLLPTGAPVELALSGRFFPKEAGDQAGALT